VKHTGSHAGQEPPQSTPSSSPFCSSSEQVGGYSTQALSTQAAVDPAGAVHTMPQPAQLFGSVSVFDSQPLAWSPSQSVNPFRQKAKVQVPVLQLPAAFWGEQGAPHDPQLPTVVRDVSQPLSRSPSQLAHRASHTGVHTPAAQVVLPCPLAHVLPQVPQLASLVFRSASQPFCGSPSQSPQPGSQATSWQVPVWQLSEAWARSQATPQAPQLEFALSGASQPFSASPSQSAWVGVQLVISQAPVAQVPLAFGGAQVPPQAPQLASVVRVVSQPFCKLPSQSPQPALHAGRHSPASQVAVPLALRHATPQAPQLAGSVFKAASQPSSLPPLQLAKPAAQLPTVQAPAEQAPAAFGGEHVSPQPPQCAAEARRLVSQPFCGSSSQSPVPAGHSPTV
jgi:hypothetical protein